MSNLKLTCQEEQDFIRLATVLTKFGTKKKMVHALYNLTKENAINSGNLFEALFNLVCNGN